MGFTESEVREMLTYYSNTGHFNHTIDELIEIMAEILAIAKAKNGEEAESKLKNVMKKITDTADTADAMLKLTNWAMIAYNAILPIIQK